MATNTSFIDRLKAIVYENYSDERFGVSELVAFYGISRSQLHKKLKKEVGKSISQFIKEIRLEESLKLLQGTDYTVSEIAYQVGFGSPAYFNTCFKDFYGFPPGEAKVRAEARSELSKDLTSDKTEVRILDLPGKKQNLWALLVIVILVIGVIGYYELRNSPNLPEINSPLAVINKDSDSLEKTVAVLPLKNWSGDPELEYISDGMTDAIINRLAKIKSIKRVIPFTSMLAYKKTDKSIVEIAKELGVKNILQGSFQISGDNVSIKVQMIDGISEQQYWENAYYQIWKTTEIFEIQSAVAENVAENINASITESEKKSIEQIPTSNKEAYRLYLQGNYQHQQLGGGSITNAMHLYERAIALDSTFIEPYFGLSGAYSLSGMVWGIIPEKEAWSNTKLILEKALKIDQRNSNAYQEAITRDYVVGAFYYEWDIEAIESFYNSTPDIIKPYVGVVEKQAFFDFAVKAGKFDDYLLIANYNLDNFPTLGASYAIKASALFFLGRKEEAIELLSIQDEIYDNDYFYLMETAKYYFYLGVQEKSKKQLSLFKSQFADRPPIIIWLGAVHAEMEEKTELVAKNLSLLEEAYNQKSSGSPAWFMALYYCHIKDYNKAFEWLWKSYDRHEIEMTWLKEEPILRPLKKDPRYLELYEKVGFSKLDL